VLRRFFEHYRGRSIAGAAPEELRAALARAADAVFDAFERRLPPLNPKLWRIERRMLGILLERMLDDEVELQTRLASLAMSPRYLEIAFGMTLRDADAASSAEPLVLRRDAADHGSETIRLRGQIDRVDASADGMLVAYDYKTSAGPRVADMRDGRDHQLGIYLAAIEHLFAGAGEQIAGGGYYALRPVAPRRNNGLYRADLAPYTDIRPTCASSLAPDAWRALRDAIHENLWIAYDRIRDGDFRVVPSQDEATCTHCDYVRVCRFDRQRIQIKRRTDDVPRDRPLRPANRDGDRITGSRSDGLA